MACMEARALKSSLFSELAMKPTTSQGLSDDIWCVTGFSGDDISIDEFFDLPNEDTNKNASLLEVDDEEKYSSSLSLSSQDLVDDTNSNFPNFSPDLAIPDDDLQELELWSHLMDDSVPEATFACPKPIIDELTKTGFNFGNRFEPGLGRVSFIPVAIPVKPRSKRVRTGGNYAWLTASPLKPESSSSSSSSSPVSTLVFPNPIHDMGIMLFPFGKPPVKKPKKKPASVSREVGSSTVQRRCTHCQVMKTPQWRTGPNGPKTLCNACGVRFKFGRLFPEYRPACSPTFSIAVHSNSHRKVLEMRSKKATPGSVTGLTPTV